MLDYMYMYAKLTYLSISTTFGVHNFLTFVKSLLRLLRITVHSTIILSRNVLKVNMLPAQPKKPYIIQVALPGKVIGVVIPKPKNSHIRNLIRRIHTNDESCDCHVAVCFCLWHIETQESGQPDSLKVIHFQFHITIKRACQSMHSDWIEPGIFRPDLFNNKKYCNTTMLMHLLHSCTWGAMLLN